MSEPVISARRWNSYVCPGCRGIFRVPQDHDGHGVVCPACRVMLRLPQPEDKVPPLLKPARTAPADEPEPEDEEDYEDGGEMAEQETAAREDRNFMLLLGTVALSLVGFVTWWMFSGDDKRTPAAPAIAPVVVEDAAAEEAPAPVTPRNLMVQVEEVVKAFLEAPTREEALEYVADREATAEKWAAWDKEPYEKPGYRELLSDPVTQGKGEAMVATVNIRTAGFDMRQVSVVRDGGEWRVDWESWAGWSEMPWDEFLAGKPSRPVMFRVMLSKLDYYNFDFSDDREWSSFRLSPGGDEFRPVYGYAKAGTEMEKSLRPSDAGEKVRWMLKLRYPENATREDQVIIDSIVAQDWVAPRTESP